MGDVFGGDGWKDSSVEDTFRVFCEFAVTCAATTKQTNVRPLPSPVPLLSQ